MDGSLLGGREFKYDFFPAGHAAALQVRNSSGVNVKLLENFVSRFGFQLAGPSGERTPDEPSKRSFQRALC